MSNRRPAGSPDERRHLTQQEFRDAAKQDASASGVVLSFKADPETEIDEASRTIRYCFSDGSVDRAGDTIDPSGWDIGPFRDNSVALWAHRSSEPPIGKALDVKIEGKRLMGSIQFATAEEYAFADTIYRLAKGGYVKAVSVGFIPKEWSFVNDDDRPFGIDFKRQELLEISLCPVPCNANALQEAKAAGLDTKLFDEWIERMLAGNGMAVLPRKQLDAILGLPEKFRGIAKQLPAAAKGARGQLLRCANIAEREIKAEAGQPNDEPAPNDQPDTTETGDQPEADKTQPAGTPRLSLARRRLELARRSIS